MKLKEITNKLEELAPLSLQESYDNSGLIIGEADMEINGAIISLDVTEEVIQEAIMNGANLIISHHPVVFTGLKKFNNRGMVQRIINQCIKKDIAIYAIHTNLDNVKLGVNKKIGDKISEVMPLKHLRILDPKPNLLNRLTVFLPISEEYPDLKKKICEAAFNAGAGKIGNYSECSFSNEGISTFKGNENANPTLGEKNIREHVHEISIDFLVPSHSIPKVLSAIKGVHIYEELAYFLTPHVSTHQDIGSGMIAELEEEVPIQQFLENIKEIFEVGCIRFTKPHIQKINKIAFCGGSGSFLLEKAIQEKADVFISADFKYHQFFDADKNIIICDIGHYEIEQFSTELIFDYLTEKFPNFALLKSSVETNPVYYI